MYIYKIDIGEMELTKFKLHSETKQHYIQEVNANTHIMHDKLASSNSFYTSKKEAHSFFTFLLAKRVEELEYDLSDARTQFDEFVEKNNNHYE